MNARLTELTRRRESLISRSTSQRAELRKACDDIRNSLSLMKAGAALVQGLRFYPELALGLTAFTLGGPRGKVTKLSERLGLSWGIFRLVRAFWRRRRQSSIQ